MPPKPLEDDFGLDASTSSTRTATTAGASPSAGDGSTLMPPTGVQIDAGNKLNMNGKKKVPSGIVAVESFDDHDEATIEQEAYAAEEEEMSCERLYGPYPQVPPAPYRSKDDTKAEADTKTSASCDYRDANTPDEWLKRDGRLVRLTGRHPFNVEPPLSIHDEYKFLTPVHLQYVRNHGACPRLSWEHHRVAVTGATEDDTRHVSSPLSLSMDDLAAMTPRELPVTLVCAGNRRKEQNMIRQTIGFNWGPSGVSTSVFRGVPLRDLLLRAGVSEKNMRGKHVEFVGHEDLPNKVGPGPFEDEPWGKSVKYGTSIPLARAMNPAYDVLVAYEANGERLTPDHGFPVRVVIPGYIGGRMIKWLSTIKVLSHETKNHYHYHDNRILPPNITSEESLSGRWWYKPQYIFNELNINSAIARPDHGETIPIKRMMGKEYEMTGYAYTGGGRAITRVEISTNGGTNWELARIERREKPTEYGMHWCWIWWYFNLPVADLVGCDELWVRAFDDANNMQPDQPTWNLMGMGNNQVFRIKVHVDKSDRGEHVFRFEHPTQPGQEQGGWMTRLVDKPPSAGFGLLKEMLDGQDKSAPSDAKAAKVDSGGRKISIDEVAKHNKEDDVWIVVNDKVYDCTEYLELHPGGADSITINAGADATEDFVAIHSDKATKMLEKFYVGDLDKASVGQDMPLLTEEGKTDDMGRPIALDPKRKIAFKLQRKVVLSHDSFLLDFALQSPRHVLGLPTGKHVFLSAKVNGEMVMRRYTPITSDHDLGCVKFVIKAYRPCPRFPNGGKLSQHLDSLRVGEDTIDIRGPVGEFHYLSNGNFTIDGEQGHATHFNMIAGGTGITPVMQIAAEVLRHPDDGTKMTLIFGCREEGDLLMRSTLEEWEGLYPNRFRVEYILSDAWPKDWKYSTGFVGKDLFDKHLYPASGTVYNLMCGPPIMLEKGCIPNLRALGHAKDHIFGF